MQVIKQFKFSPNGYSVFTFNPGDSIDETDPAIEYGLKIGAVVQSEGSGNMNTPTNSGDAMATPSVKPVEPAIIETPEPVAIDNKAVGQVAKPGKKKAA